MTPSSPSENDCSVPSADPAPLTGVLVVMVLAPPYWVGPLRSIVTGPGQVVVLDGVKVIVPPGRPVADVSRVPFALKLIVPAAGLVVRAVAPSLTVKVHDVAEALVNT